jgi:hypothetical protein
MHFAGNDKPAIFEHECGCMAAMTLVHLVGIYGHALRSMSAAWPVHMLEVDAWVRPKDRCIVCSSGAKQPKQPGRNGCGCLTVKELSHLLDVATHDLALKVASEWSMIVLPEDTGAAPITTDIRTIARLREFTGPVPVSNDGPGAASFLGFVAFKPPLISYKREEGFHCN